MRQPSLKRTTTATIAGLIVVLDQATKAWAQRVLQDGPVELVEGFLTFRLTFNSGAAFSSFEGLGSAIAFLALGIAVFLWVVAGRSTLNYELVVYGLIIGGALGNAADRFLRADGIADGSVVDFIDVGFIPVFNVADSAITVGVALALLFSFFPRAESEMQKSEINDPV